MTDRSTLETTELGAGRVRLEIETSATTAALISDLVAARDSDGEADGEAGGVREVGHSSGPPAD